MNELRKKYKEETKQPIIEKPMGNFDYFKDEYVFWLESKLEDINNTHCCTEVCDHSWRVNQITNSVYCKKCKALKIK